MCRYSMKAAKKRITVIFVLAAFLLFFVCTGFFNARKASAESERHKEKQDVKEDMPEDKGRLQADPDLPHIPYARDDLGLRLIGTVMMDEPGGSIAIIEIVALGEQEVYKEGDTLEGVLIKRILNRTVIIDEGKGDEMIVMQGGTSTGTRPSESQRVQLERKAVDSEVPSYSDMMKDIRVRPYRQEGKPGGFMIYNIKPGSIFAKMGLDNGDVITAVNRKPVTTTLQAADFYQALRQNGEVIIDVKRGDANQKLRFEIK